MSEHWRPTPEESYVTCESCGERNRPGSTRCARCGAPVAPAPGEPDPELANFVRAQERAARPRRWRDLVEVRSGRKLAGPARAGATRGPALVSGVAPERYVSCAACAERNREGTTRCARCGAVLG